MKLGPFKEEHICDIPYTVVFHDILSDTEMSFLKDESRPNLSRKRQFNRNNSGSRTNNEIKSGEHRRINHKTVQAWLKEVEWPNLTTIEDYSGKTKTFSNRSLVLGRGSKKTLKQHYDAIQHQRCVVS